MASKNTRGISRIVSSLKRRQASTGSVTTSSGSVKSSKKRNATTGRASGGGSSRPKRDSNVEVKFFKSDGTPVFGAKSERSVVPSGATAATGANIQPTTQTATQTRKTIGKSLLERQTAERQRRGLSTIDTVQKKSIKTSLGTQQQVTQKVSQPSGQFGGKSISAATPEQIRATQRSRNPFISGTRTFFRSAFDPTPKTGQTIRTGEPVQQAAAFGGVVAGIGFSRVGKTAKAAKTVVAGSRFVKPVVSKGKSVVESIRSSLGAVRATRAGQAATRAAQTRVGRTVVGAGKVTAQSVAVAETVEFGVKSTAPKEQRRLRKTSEFQESFSIARQERKKVIEQSGLVSQIASGVSLGFAPKAAKQQFETSLRKEAVVRGLDPELTVRAGRRVSRAEIGGETAGFLGAARGAESIGRREVTRAFSVASVKGEQIVKKQAFGKLFKKTFVPIGQAGVAEGVASEVVQSRQRAEKIRAKNLAISGGIGFGTAGAIGGVIAGTRVTRPTVSKVVEVGTFITDPFEKPGDIAQDITEFGVRKVTGRRPPVPTITTQVSPDQFLKLGTTKPTRTKRGGRVRGGIFSFGSPTQTRTPVITPSVSPSQNPFNIGRSSVNIGQPIPRPGSPVITPSPTGIPINPIDSPVNIPEESPVNIPSNVPVNVGVSIPTRSPLFRVPPPIPPTLPFSFGRGRTRKGKRKKFVDEVSQFNMFLNRGLQLGAAPRRKRRKK